MLGRPLATAPLATLLPGLAIGTQTVTVRYASESFVTRSGDSPASTFIPGRLGSGLRLDRFIDDADAGQFGALIEARFGEIELNNADGQLDVLLNSYYADGREIRLKIGGKTQLAPDRLMPQFIATGAGASSGDSSVPYEMDYPPDNVFPGDLFVAQITIHDRGEAGGITSIPEPWEILDENTSGSLYEALIWHFATGEEAGETAAVEWQSGDADNDAISGRIHQFRYVDQDNPFQDLTEAIIGDLGSVNLPELTTTVRNSLATYWVSWSDNVSTSSPSGATGGMWANIGDIVSSSTGDDLANRRAGAEMVEPGTISGGSIATTPTP